MTFCQRRSTFRRICIGQVFLICVRNVTLAWCFFYISMDRFRKSRWRPSIFKWQVRRDSSKNVLASSRVSDTRRMNQSRAFSPCESWPWPLCFVSSGLSAITWRLGSLKKQNATGVWYCPVTQDRAAFRAASARSSRCKSPRLCCRTLNVSFNCAFDL